MAAIIKNGAVQQVVVQGIFLNETAREFGSESQRIKAAASEQIFWVVTGVTSIADLRQFMIVQARV